MTHAGGETTVTVNQEVNNGAWFLLGTFNLAPASGHKVSLTDQANGYVIADAIRIIGTDEPQANSATWSPNLTGEHQVYAKWTAHANRATNATYTITHAGGTTQVAVNQQANGGQFNLLGTFTLSPASTITLTDNADGFVIADAVQLVATAPVAAQMYFVHTDHLNTPRLIANGAGQAVWRWDNDDPFGANVPNENPSGLGLFTCNLRLPGQYFDKETNLHYNYFRDYEPGIGRYIQSDPIGLKGGINLYLYVLANPLFLTDPLGLANQIEVDLKNAILKNNALIQKYGENSILQAVNDGLGGLLGIVCTEEICLKQIRNDIDDCCVQKVVNIAAAAPDVVSRGAFGRASMDGLLGSCLRHGRRLTGSPGFKRNCPGC